jgi:putative transcriptional regulator
MLRRTVNTLMAVLCAVLLVAAKPAGEPALSKFVVGRLLVAVPKMPDERFRNSIILMVEHNGEGAFGLMVNKPLGFAEFEVESKQEGVGMLPTQKTKVFWGGPVEPEKTFIVHSTDYQNDGTLKVAEGVWMTANVEILHAIATGKGPKHKLHVIGYSGWAPGQLDTEISRDDWYTAPVTPEIVFGEKQQGKWEKALEERYRDL